MVGGRRVGGGGCSQGGGREVVTCSGAHAPGGQAVGRGEAVEHADVLRTEELHKLGVGKHLSFTVQDGRHLV